MNIGFDIDGVLIDTEKYQFVYGQRFFKKQGLSVINKHGYGIKEVFGCSEELEKKFWYRYMVHYALFSKPRAYAKFIIQKIRAEGHNIHVITSRAYTDKKNFVGWLMRLLVRIWLKQNGIVFDDITFCSVVASSIEKADICKQYNIDIMVDDYIENIINICKCTKTICFETLNNHGFSHEQVLKAKDFHDVHLYVQQHILERECSKAGFTLLSRQERAKLSHSDLNKYMADLRLVYANTTNNHDEIRKGEKGYKSIYSLGSKIYDMFVKYEVLNIDLIPTVKTSLIFVFNHSDLMDIPTIMRSVTKDTPVHALAKIELLNTPSGKVLEKIGAVFLARDSAASSACSKNTLLRILLEGGNILIAPEGTRNKTNELLLPFSLGAVSLAEKTGSLIIPCAITKKSKGTRTVRIGVPVKVNIGEDLVLANQGLAEIMSDMLLQDRCCNRA